MATSKDAALVDILKKKYIDLHLEGGDKNEVLAELVALAGSSGKIKNKKSLLELLKEREKLGSTGIGNGVAIPHAKIDGIKEPMLTFGRSADGVNFNCLDGEDAYIFFMLISPKEEVGQHLKILARISRIMKDKFTISLLKKAKNPEELIKIITTAEKHLNTGPQ